VCFPLNVSIAYSPKLTFVADGNNQTGIGLTLGETICFGSLEFTADCFSNLSLSPEGNHSGAVFVGMVHSGSPSMHTVLEESFDEGDIASVGGGVTIPITTTPSLENTPALLTIPTVQQRTIAP
jgi:hypothetical protein